MTWRDAAEKRRRRFEREERELPWRMRQAKRTHIVVFVVVMVLGAGAVLLDLWRRGEYVMLFAVVGMIGLAAALVRAMTRSKRARRARDPDSIRWEQNP